MEADDDEKEDEEVGEANAVEHAVAGMDVGVEKKRCGEAKRKEEKMSD